MAEKVGARLGKCEILFGQVPGWKERELPMITISRAVKSLFLLTALSGLSACAVLSKPPVGNTRVPEPAKAVELNRYIGRWYEIYRYDAAFQKGCEGSMADYALNDDGSIRVLNTCRKGAVNGPIKTAKARAVVKDKATNAKLKVTFFWPFSGDYWVLDRGDDYQWAIVGEPSGRYLWVLSRNATPSAEEKALYRQRVESMGYNWALVRETKQQ